MEQQNFFNILGVERQELVHSKFISWLLNSNSSHGLGTKPLENFLNLLYKAIHKKVNTPNKDIYHTLLKKLSNKSNKISNVEVTNETDKIDITIKFIINGDDKTPIKILIENKVGARETQSQTKKYYDENNSRNVIFVYLTPLPSVQLEQLNEPECECKQYIQINYQQLLDDVIEPASKHELLKFAHNKNKIFINEYIMNLSAIPQKEKLDTIMAIPMEEQVKLWKDVKNNKENFAKKLLNFARLSPELQEYSTVIEKITDDILKKSEQRFLVLYNRCIYCEQSAKDTLYKVLMQIIADNGINKVIEATRKSKTKSLLTVDKPVKSRSYTQIEGTAFFLNTDNGNEQKIVFLNNLKDKLDLDLQV